jgi:hypothetical protein
MIKKEEVFMPRKFRLTCARTTYFDVELAAESSAEAERLVEAAFKNSADLLESGQAIGKPMQRVVEVAATEDSDAGLRDAAA